MVFFSCNVCNESLKKNQVEKHLMKCRRCESLSCIDCGKEFWGDSYQSHTKCISEEEKYSGKNFVAKPNKGEVKQGQWIQKVQSAIGKAPSNPQLKSLLERLEDFPNVPRKKAKFENFLKCSLRVMNKGLMDQVWDLLMAETQQPAQNGNNSSTTNSQSSQASAESSNSAKPAEEDEAAEEEGGETEKKLSKRERKELRQKKAHKGEKKDKQAPDGATEEEASGKKKKGGKRKRRDEEEEEDEEQAEAEDISGKKKKGKHRKTEEEEEEVVVSKPKKKKRKGENGTAVETEEDGEGKLNDTLQDVEHKGKFDWGQTITAVLQSKGEIAVKKLQKKVLAEYLSYGSNKPEDRLEAKFLKKLTKMPNVKVLKDRARLTQS